MLGVEFDQDPDYANLLAETKALALAALFEIVSKVEGKRKVPDRKYFIGTGKLAELIDAIKEHDADVVVVTHTLSSSQHRSLSEAISKEVLDYSGLILTIFSERAVTAEGKLQVSLAQEIYGRSKLRGAWTHLERQRGGLGATAGPGERQIELDRRLIQRRIKTLRRQLDNRRAHTMRLSKSRRGNFFSVALVGYTNAGKSTLFTKLTHCKQRATSRVFETLDTTTRQMYLAKGKKAVLSDTVGFIRNLPHELIEAFQSTLTEVATADLLLVVLDLSDVSMRSKLDTVFNTLDTIGASSIPKIAVLNKCDLSSSLPDGSLLGSVGLGLSGRINVCPISAATGEGLDSLSNCIEGYFNDIFIKSRSAKSRSMLSSPS